MKNKARGKRVLISVLIVVVWAALGLMTGTRRVSATTFTVTNTKDSGAGSLRQAIADAMPGDTIDFNLAGCPCTITLTSGELVINKSLTIQGPGASQLTVSGGGVSRVFFIGRLDITPSGFTVTLDGLTVTGGNGVGAFGAIITGGGIHNNIGTTLTVSNSTVFGNTADLGGGLYNNAGTLILNNSTVTGNTANFYGGINNHNGTMTVTNSTISANSAATFGGGINNFASTLTVTNSTISGNSASFGGGINNDGKATFKNSIIANSPSGGNCGGSVPIAPVGVNFSTDNTCTGFTQVTALQLNLGPLQDNGGPTFTHALLPGSVAIDAVTDCTDLSATPVTTDQRGQPRPKDGDGNGSALCDAGAFELQPCSITCPANITVSNDLNQCGAVVNYPAPTTSGDCFTIICSPTSGSFFPVGTTTVTCTTTAGPSCTFTVTVNDTQPPSITCPANVTAVAAQTCPISSTATVTFPAPTVSDNCLGVTSVCNPPSGSILPVGTTTVTCTATDASGNTATCTFTVTVFSGCLQDDSNPANVVLFNAATGEYRFCCNGTVFTGVGTLIVKGCVVTIQHYPADRRVLIKFDGAVGAGTASLQSPPGSIRCTITDRNTKNNTCACQ